MTELWIIPREMKLYEMISIPPGIEYTNCHEWNFWKTIQFPYEMKIYNLEFCSTSSRDLTKWQKRQKTNGSLKIISKFASNGTLFGFYKGDTNEKKYSLGLPTEH